MTIHLWNEIMCRLAPERKAKIDRRINMSLSKKEIRKKFRDVCFARDKYSCVMCGLQTSKALAEFQLDCHHIIPRKDMPNGGYVKENGVSLCAVCHQKAEDFYCLGVTDPGFFPEDLLFMIGSSRHKAFEAAIQLGSV